jgi:hypothetical protein
MQDAWDVYKSVQYMPQLGIQGFYDTLINHAQNMSVYPDNYNIMDTFLHGLPADMCKELLKNDLMPEANMVDDFVAEGKAHEATLKTLEHYDKQASQGTMKLRASCHQSCHKTKMKKVGVTFVKKTDLWPVTDGNKPWIFINWNSMRTPVPKAVGNYVNRFKPWHEHTHKQNTKHDNKKDHKHDHGPDIHYQCRKLGHFTMDCPEAKQANIWVSHTEVDQDPDPMDREGPSGEEPNMANVAENNSEPHDEQPKEDLIEINMYENNWYEHNSDTDYVHAMHQSQQKENSCCW